MNIEIKKLMRSVYLVFSVIIVVILLLFWFFTHSIVSFQVAPRNATLSIDGTTVTDLKNGSVIKSLSPGQHLVSVQADGYVGINQEVDFGRGIAKKITVTLENNPEPLTITNTVTPDSLAISQNARFLTKGSDFNDFYYLDGKILYKARVKADTGQKVTLLNKIPITNPVISDVSEIVWSPSFDLALFRKTTGINIFDFQKYDFVNQTETSWGQDVGNIAWAPDNSKIAYYYAPATGERSLIFANTTNADVTRVYNFKDLGIENPILHWSPDSQYLLVIPQNKDASLNKIYLFDSYSRTLSMIADTGNQLDAMFSPDGNKIIYSTYSKDPTGAVNSILSIMNKDGSNKKSLDLRAELSKITWSKNSTDIIVASYDQGTKKESLFMYDTDKKEQTGFIIKNFGDIYIQSLILTDDNNVIIYQDKDGISAINID